MSYAYKAVGLYELLKATRSATLILVLIAVSALYSAAESAQYIREFATNTDRDFLKTQRLFSPGDVVSGRDPSRVLISSSSCYEAVASITDESSVTVPPTMHSISRTEIQAGLLETFNIFRDSATIKVIYFDDSVSKFVLEEAGLLDRMSDACKHRIRRYHDLGSDPQIVVETVQTRLLHVEVKVREVKGGVELNEDALIKVTSLIVGLLGKCATGEDCIAFVGGREALGIVGLTRVFQSELAAYSTVAKDKSWNEPRTITADLVPAMKILALEMP